MTTTAPVFVQHVEIPDPPRSRLGVLSVSLVGERPHGPWQFGLAWDSPLCAEATGQDGSLCFDPAHPKFTNGVYVTESAPITVSAFVECGLLGAEDRYERIARTVLDARASETIELKLAERWNEDPDHHGFDAGAVDVVEAFASLEEMASRYAGPAVIHITPRWATYAANENLVVREDGEVVTHCGTRVSIGHGYRTWSERPAGPVTPAAGEAWLYVTGWTRFIRGPVTERMAVDMRTNRKQVAVEQVYVPMVDCFVGGVLAARGTP
jgi:hypothetical protein